MADRLVHKMKNPYAAYEIHYSDGECEHSYVGITALRYQEILYRTGKKGIRRAGFQNLESCKEAIERRLKEHIRKSKTGTAPLYEAMRKHGAENFQCSLLDVADGLDEALLLEQKMIIYTGAKLNVLRGKQCVAYIELLHEIVDELLQKNKKSLQYAKGLARWAPSNSREKSLDKLTKREVELHDLTEKAEKIRRRFDESRKDSPAIQ